jgi:hypothetical protein
MTRTIRIGPKHSHDAHDDRSRPWLRVKQGKGAGAPPSVHRANLDAGIGILHPKEKPCRTLKNRLNAWSRSS